MHSNRMRDTVSNLKKKEDPHETKGGSQKVSMEGGMSKSQLRLERLRDMPSDL
jgi:hypothetical protein